MRRLIVAMVVGVFVVAAGGAEQAKDAKDAPKELSAKDAFTRLIGSMVRGDVEAVKAGMYAADEQSRKILGWFEQTTTAAAEARKAVLAKFGDAAKKPLEKSGVVFSKKELAAMIEKVDGDTATVWLGDPEGNDPIAMRKIDGVWKLDIAGMSAQEEWKPEALAKHTTASVKRLGQLKSKVENGEFKTAREAADALKAAVLDVQEDESTEPEGL